MICMVLNAWCNAVIPGARTAVLYDTLEIVLTGVRIILYHVLFFEFSVLSEPPHHTTTAPHTTPTENISSNHPRSKGALVGHLFWGTHVTDPGITYTWYEVVLKDTVAVAKTSDS